MESFSLLKYWRGGGGAPLSADNAASNLRTCTAPPSATTTIVTAVTEHEMETDAEDGDDDDGPFFDLEFAVPDEDEEEGDEIKNNKQEEDDVSEEDVESDATQDDEREFNFTLSSGSSNDRADSNLPLSPSDDLFFKGRLVPIEPSLNAADLSTKPQFPVSLLKSATKFRVFMLGFKKSKPPQTGNDKTEAAGAGDTPKKGGEANKHQRNLFTVKFKVEEVPIVSLFTRDSSSRNSTNKQKQNGEEPVSDEKRFSKDVMHKYLKKMKPLYVRVSRRYGEKLRFSGQLSFGSGTTSLSSSSSVGKSGGEKGESEGENGESQVRSQKQGNIPAGLRVVCKHLGKSRSASSAAVAAAPSAPVVSRRRDDSLLQQQDGIQGAILHCKRSFNSSRESEASVLPRSVSDPCHEKSTESSRK